MLYIAVTTVTFYNKAWWLSQVSHIIMWYIEGHKSFWNNNVILYVNNK